jgi:hypothetical protein
MIPVPSGVQVWLATGHTDMRKGFDGLALLVQETLGRQDSNLRISESELVKSFEIAHRFRRACLTPRVSRGLSASGQQAVVSIH